MEKHWLEDSVATMAPGILRSVMLRGTETEARERAEAREALRTLDASLTGFAEAITREVGCEMQTAVALMLSEPSEAAGKVGCSVDDAGSWCERVLAGDTWWRS